MLAEEVANHDSDELLLPVYDDPMHILHIEGLLDFENSIDFENSRDFEINPDEHLKNPVDFEDSLLEENFVENPVEKFIENLVKIPTENVVEAEPPGNLVENSIENPVKKPMEITVENPVKNAVEKPMMNIQEKPMENPAEKSTENPVEKSMENPAEKLTENLAETSTENSVNKSMENPAEKSMENLVEKTMANSVEKSIENHVEKSMANPVEKSMENHVEKSMDNPVDFENSVVNPMANEEKPIRRRISLVQKELMVNFVIENPEIITHSGTKEKEIQLWNDLHQKLNIVKPEKSLECWKKYFNRWKSQIMTKPDDAGSLTVVEYKLKQFLNKIQFTNNNPLPNSQGIVKSSSSPKPTVGNILEKIIEVEKERSNVRLEIDNNELRINKYKYLIRALEDENELKHARIKKLTVAKMYLNKRRRALLLHGEKEQDNCEIEEKKIKIELNPEDD